MWELHCSGPLDRGRAKRTKLGNTLLDQAAAREAYLPWVAVTCSACDRIGLEATSAGLGEDQLDWRPPTVRPVVSSNIVSCTYLPRITGRNGMIMTERGGNTDARRSAVTSAPLLSRSAGPLAIAAGTLLIVGQAIWWPFDQQKNLATAQNDIFNAGSVIYFCGFCVLMFALIGVHGKQAHRAGRLGTFGFCTAVLGTMFLGGDLWFESFAVPWLAEGPFPQVLQSDPSILFALGAISSYLLFAIGWVFFGVASLRARVFPVWISILIVIGGIAGYKALLSPWGIPLGVAVATLGGWMLRRRSATMVDSSLRRLGPEHG
jgi:hypothetical protein